MYKRMIPSMTSSDFDAIQDEQQEIRKQYRFSLQLFYGVVLVGVGIWIGSRLFADDGGYVTNLYTEFISIGVTVFILDLLARYREQKREKAMILHEIRIGDNRTARLALERLRLSDWSMDTSLAEAWLPGARLTRASLQGMNLSSAQLSLADLSDANLVGANLRGVELYDADLRRTRLYGADLTRAKLDNAKIVSKTEHIYLSKNTMLPDGTYWTPGRSLTEFGAVEIPPDATP